MEVIKALKHSFIKKPAALEVFIGSIFFLSISLIILPKYIGAIERLRSQEAVSEIKSIRASINRFWYKNRFIPIDINSLDIDNPNNVRDNLYTYSVIDQGTNSKIRNYTITAEFKVSNGNANGGLYWVQEDNNTGHFYRAKQ